MLRRLRLALWSAALICVVWAWAPWLAWLAPVPFVLALRGASVREAIYLGAVVGGLQALVLSGILFAGVPLFAALVITYALAGALFGALFTIVADRREGWAMSALAASCWVSVEWLHAAIPYSASNLLGDSQWTGPFLPLARLGGSFLVSFVLVWLAASLVATFEPTARPRRRVHPLGLAVTVTLVLLVAAWLTRPAPGPRPPLTVAVIQGGLPTWLYARAEAQPSWRSVPEEIYLALTDSAPEAKLTIWPETAVWRYWGDDPAYEALLRAVRADRDAALLVGAPRRDDAASFANTGVLLTADGPVAFADKRRLALLAEIGFAPGHRPSVLKLGDQAGSLGVIFCLETVAPHYIREVVAAGAETVVVLAEGSRFGQTRVAQIHANHSVVRAVEVGRDLIHAGQHGFSTLITADGERSAPLPPYTAAVLDGAISLYDQTTPYVRFGPWIIAVAGLMIGLGAAWRLVELWRVLVGRREGRLNHRSRS